jgi:hypothetical protein
VGDALSFWLLSLLWEFSLELAGASLPPLLQTLLKVLLRLKRRFEAERDCCQACSQQSVQDVNPLSAVLL